MDAQRLERGEAASEAGEGEVSCGEAGGFEGVDGLREAIKCLEGRHEMAHVTCI